MIIDNSFKKQQTQILRVTTALGCYYWPSAHFGPFLPRDRSVCYYWPSVHFGSFPPRDRSVCYSWPFHSFGPFPAGLQWGQLLAVNPLCSTVQHWTRMFHVVNPRFSVKCQPLGCKGKRILGRNEALTLLYLWLHENNI